jgi:hypothetical protein
MAKKPIKRGRGRPAAENPDDNRSEIVPVRMSPAERESCERAAERAKTGLSAWIRDSLAKAAKRNAEPKA